MYRLKSYGGAARIQMDRLQQELQHAGSGVPDWADSQQQAFVDLHLYFVIWSAIDSMLCLLVRRSGYDGLKTIYQRHRAELEHYGAARDHLEHFDERLPGGKAKLNVPGDLGNLTGEFYSLGGDKWDVSRRSLQRLESIVADFERAIREEGIRRFEAKHAAERSASST